MEHARPTIRINSLNVLLLISLFGLMTLLAACGSTAQQPAPPSSLAVLARALAGQTDSMHVYDSTRTRVSNLFDNNFDLGAGRPIQLREQELPWTDLAALIPTDPGRHGLCFDFGLEVDSMRFGISVLDLKTTTDPGRFTYELPDSLYVLAKSKLDKRAATKWRKDAQVDKDNPAVYFSRVRVQHKPGSGYEPVDLDADAHAEVMAWDDELLRLYTQNASGHGDSTFFAVFRCISKADDTDQLRHRVCIHLRLRPKDATSGPFRDLLDNTRDGNNLLRRHGADYGNLNPPGSDWYDLPPE